MWGQLVPDRSADPGGSGQHLDMRASGTLLDAQTKRATTILTTARGTPWGKVHFQHHWRAAMRAAGLDGLHFHGVRGTTCTLLAEAGATPWATAAVLGWTVPTVTRMPDTYQSMTAAPSDSAVTKMEARARCARNKVRKPCGSLGHVLAGAAGFEPANAGTKNRCLTTWRRPNEPRALAGRAGKLNRYDAASRANLRRGRAGSHSAVRGSAR